MWKLSFIVLSLITIANTSPRPETPEISRNFRDYGNQGYRTEDRSVEYSEAEIDRRDAKDYSDEFVGEELIGKWRNSGAALEPKWRDGDSLPLVPFDDSPEQKRFNDRAETMKSLETSMVFEKFIEPEERLSRIRVVDEETIDKIRIPLEYEYSASNDDSSSRNNRFKGLERAAKIPATRLTNSMLYEAAEKIPNSGEPTTKNIDNNKNTKSRQGDSFKGNFNAYDINDEEYQKPRPRKRRPPQNDEFVETRPPTYSITWSTEKYIENTEGPRKASTTATRKLEVPARRENGEKKTVRNRKLSESSSFDSRRRSENAELKSLLKMQQIEGLSLSELLQRRNFTLNDLLRGKAEVLNVLKANGNESAETFGVRSKIFEPKKLYSIAEATNRRSPSPSRLEKTSNLSFNEISKMPKSENNSEAESSTRIVENEDSRGKIDSSESGNDDDDDDDGSSKENEKLSAIVRLAKPIIFRPEAGNEKEAARDSPETTRKDENIEKKTVSSLDDDEIMEFSDFTVKKKPEMANAREETTERGREIVDDFGSTLSIENILGDARRTAAILSINVTNNVDNKVEAASSNGNNSGSDVFRDLDFDYQSDQPRESLGEDILEDKIVKIDEHSKKSSSGEKMEKIEDEDRSESNLARNHLIFSTGGKPYELAISEIEPEARAEIFELFSTGSSAKRLERLLKSRNMSIDELIELRQRGSSKVHLAEILRSRESVDSRDNGNDGKIGEKTREETTSERIVPETTTDDLSDIEIDSTSTETREATISEEQTNISFIGTEKIRYDSTIGRNNDKNHRFLELPRAFDSLPFSVRPEKSTIHEETRPDDDFKVVGEPKNSSNLVEIGLVEEIVEKESASIEDFTETNVRANYSSVGNNGNRRNLSKVRPSIIASGAILGVTIVVFLAIFIVCRIKQKQKYTYRNNFSRAVFQGPAMTARKLSNTSSVNTIMVNVVATSTTKRTDRRDDEHEIDENYESKSDIENDSLDANDSWETIPDFMK